MKTRIVPANELSPKSLLASDYFPEEPKMKLKFEKGAHVRFVFKDGTVGGLAELTAGPQLSRITEQPAREGLEHYMGEGFYHVTTIPDKRNLIVHEDDIRLEEDFTDPDGFTDPRTAAGMKGGPGYREEK